MDKTYFHIYKDLYRHLYKFCIAESTTSREALENMRDEVLHSKDAKLINLYQITVNAIDIKDGKCKFLQKTQECEASLAPDDYINRWCLYSILLLIYKYIYHDSVQVAKYENEINNATEELGKTGSWNYKFDFEDADYTIQMHINKEATMYSAYDEEYAVRDFKLQNRSFLTILKGYSSSTPFFYPALRERFHNIPIKGGGIYIKWNGTGIVIDPGINFMENLHSVGLSIKDIDIIIVTHNHIDHNGDLATIDDLAAQLDKKDIALYMDKKTEKEFSGRLINFAEENRHGLDLRLNPYLEFSVGSKNDIHIKVIPTQHILKDDGSYATNETYAVKITLKENDIKKTVIGITSDTIYFNELSEAFIDCDYIIANISETDQNDYLKKIPKQKHLGYSGCLNLIRQCNAKGKSGKLHTIVAGNPRYIISEFWAGKGDVRKELVRRLREEASYDYIYPGDIGMFFFLDQPTFLCGLCGCEQSLERLNVIRPGLEYSPFSNVCDECIL